MMKIVASIVILGFCANVCFGLAPVSSSQSAFAASVLNSTATKVLSGTNTTDSAIWDSSTANSSTANATNAGVSYTYAWFGPGATNDTSYLWGIPSASYSYSTSGAQTITSIRRRSINNTVVGWGNDTVEASVISDTSVTTTIQGDSLTHGIGPGSVLILSEGWDGATTQNQQVWVTLISGVSGSVVSSTKLTSTSDVYASAATATVGCTTTTFSLGNVWYDMGTGAFFYTYSKNVNTYYTNSTFVGMCNSTITSQTTNIYLGALFPNGSTVFASGPLTVSAVTAGNTVANLMGGGDNTLAASNIWIVYKDLTAGNTYVSKTAISNTTTAIGSFSSLIKDVSTGSAATTLVVMQYTPTSVWSSNFTYGIALLNDTTTTTTVAGTALPIYQYSFTQFYNGSTTGVDSGFSGATNAMSQALWGWQLSTGYTIVAVYETTGSGTTPNMFTFTMGTFYANGTVNGTQTSVGTLSTSGTANFFEDVNGTQWIGWFDDDTANGRVYDAYLAKFQGQLNVASGVNVFATLSIVAVFLASIFIF